METEVDVSQDKGIEENAVSPLNAAAEDAKPAQTQSIIIGKAYPITLSDEMLMTLQYTFKPGNIDSSVPGKLTFPEDTTSTVILQHTTTSSHEISFTGNVGEDKAHDYVLYLDKDQDEFKMAKVARSIQHLKPLRDEKSYSKDVLAKVTNKIQKATDVESFRKRQLAEKIKSQQAAKRKSRTKEKEDSNTKEDSAGNKETENQS
jgi:hypothetical protein